MVSELGTLRGRSTVLATARRTQRLMSRAILAMGLLILPAQALAGSEATFKRIPTQFIAALGNPDATSGSGAQSWGLWRQDPGPRGVRLDSYEQLKATGGVAPAQWKFEITWRLPVTMYLPGGNGKSGFSMIRPFSSSHQSVLSNFHCAGATPPVAFNCS